MTLPCAGTLAAPMDTHPSLRRVRFWLLVFMIGLVLSGITAFPLKTEVHWLFLLLHTPALVSFAAATHLLLWITRVDQALTSTGAEYSFLAYGTDWLAYGHLVIAGAFIGAYRDPLRNQWLLTFGLIACVGVFPLALIAGHFRGIPFGWQLVDCCFGVFGAIPLLLARRALRELERNS